MTPPAGDFINNPHFFIPAKAGIQVDQPRWMPACADMTVHQTFPGKAIAVLLGLIGKWPSHACQPIQSVAKPHFVIPAKAGIQVDQPRWMPACAGMTVHHTFPGRAIAVRLGIIRK
jgi:hypothetical protein